MILVAGRGYGGGGATKSLPGSLEGIDHPRKHASMIQENDWLKNGPQGSLSVRDLDRDLTLVPPEIEEPRALATLTRLIAISPLITETLPLNKNATT